MLFQILEIRCTVPQVPTSVTIVFPLNVTTIGYSEPIFYQCVIGHRMENGNHDVEIAICMENEQLSMNAPRCISGTSTVRVAKSSTRTCICFNVQDWASPQLIS